jgi:fatty acid desaturase
VAEQHFPGSPSLDGLIARDGRTWEQVRTALAPHYDRARRELGLAYLLMAIGLALHATASSRFGEPAGFLLAPLAALWVGYWLAAVICFMHEAAHYNLHADKRTNDRLANLLLCPLVGEEIRHYRANHWQHHLGLGSLADTEVSYRQAPTPRFLLESLLGIQVLRVIAGKRRAGSTANEGTARLGFAIARTVALHAAIVFALCWVGLYASALVWILGAGVFYPFFGSLRQMLEHRSLEARADVDYARVEHGPVNRMFGTGLFARTFGAAGFNRHLLHHWHPAASYTCFDELEGFLAATDLGPEIDAARTTYLETFIRLTSAAVGAARP